ncbi:glycoside hydrolase family 10 protein [Cylindrospermopsis raciborskii LB2897]|jgi:uncharacterized lipoprotein YddW (UPF0748 family)|uniref:glycoside hydrolase family 10 protein n=1 Tax=Cylindrospermopsis raciborskii TaxID=77022 RepID=UPI001454DB34|nr:glycoside hydrolase family 10 protein [Cylindrospermopsis raciborskii]MBG0742627.1 glycoside hydrolase family 10 protein [Cylindrospermopsis raciborskii KL1]NLQ08069.1 glycoside hydrolase family 10 protein [Cylindrospermopsis raciborskii LB2897]
MISRLFNLFIALGFLFSVIVFSLASNSVDLKTTNNPLLTEIRGVWLTNVASGVLFVPWGIERAIDQLAELNFNTIYPVVWNRGYTFYQSQVAQSVTGDITEPFLNFMNGGTDVLKKIVTLGKKKNLTVIPWFEYGFMTPPNSNLAKLHPEWLTNGRKGVNYVNVNLWEDIDSSSIFNQQLWLNPLHPQVQNFILDLILEVVKNYDVDGIQVDDHFGMPVQFGYDPFTVKLYQKEHLGKIPPSDPFNSEWMSWRANKITSLLTRIRGEVKKIKPQAKISVSPNSQDYAYKYYLQDWENWVKKNLVDELVLQVYRDDNQSFIAEIKKPAVQSALKKIPVSIGISSGTLTSPVNIHSVKQKVQIVRDSRFLGFSFFYWESLWGYISPESPQQRRKTFLKILEYPAVRPVFFRKIQ